MRDHIQNAFLNSIADLLEIEDINIVNNKELLLEKSSFGYDKLRKIGCPGYTGFYLYNVSSDDLCEEFSILDKSFSFSIYEKLTQIDRKLGTSETEQLRYTLFLSTQLDLIKVCRIIENSKVLLT